MVPSEKDLGDRSGYHLAKQPATTEVQCMAALAVAAKASAAILEAYTAKPPPKISYKDDRSPLTETDTLANQIIVDGLKAIDKHIPILSEEGSSIPYVQRKNFESLWIVDPLDGTKEFINRTGTFTVNIALWQRGELKLGIVIAPVLKETYYGVQGLGAFSVSEDGKHQKITVAPFDPREPRALVSRSHGASEEPVIRSVFPDCQIRAAGSSIKFCWVAAGRYHFYLRHHPTQEWDTAAGQCVLECAGGVVLVGSGKPLAYNRFDLENPGFIALGDTQVPWNKLLHDQVGR